MTLEQVLLSDCLWCYVHMQTADYLGKRRRCYIFQRFSGILTSTCTARSLQIAMASRTKQTQSVSSTSRMLL